MLASRDPLLVLGGSRICWSSVASHCDDSTMNSFTLPLYEAWKDRSLALARDIPRAKPPAGDNGMRHIAGHDVDPCLQCTAQEQLDGSGREVAPPRLILTSVSIASDCGSVHSTPMVSESSFI